MAHRSLAPLAAQWPISAADGSAGSRHVQAVIGDARAVGPTPLPPMRPVGRRRLENSNDPLRVLTGHPVPRPGQASGDAGLVFQRSCRRRRLAVGSWSSAPGFGRRRGIACWNASRVHAPTVGTPHVACQAGKGLLFQAESDASVSFRPAARPDRPGAIAGLGFQSASRLHPRARRAVRLCCGRFSWHQARRLRHRDPARTSWGTAQRLNPCASPPFDIDAHTARSFSSAAGRTVAKRNYFWLRLAHRGHGHRRAGVREATRPAGPADRPRASCRRSSPRLKVVGRPAALARRAAYRRGQISKARPSEPYVSLDDCKNASNRRPSGSRAWASSKVRADRRHHRTLINLQAANSPYFTEAARRSACSAPRARPRPRSQKLQLLVVPGSPISRRARKAVWTPTARPTRAEGPALRGRLRRVAGPDRRLRRFSPRLPTPFVRQMNFATCTAMSAERCASTRERTSA